MFCFSGETFASLFIEELSGVSIEQSKMSKVFIHECSLNFNWEVVVHLEHSHRDLVLIEPSAEAKANESPRDQGDLAHVPGSSLDEVGVPDSACEEDTGSC